MSYIQEGSYKGSLRIKNRSNITESSSDMEFCRVTYNMDTHFYYQEDGLACLNDKTNKRTIRKGLTFKQLLRRMDKGD